MKKTTVVLLFLMCLKPLFAAEHPEVKIGPFEPDTYKVTQNGTIDAALKTQIVVPVKKQLKYWHTLTITVIGCADRTGKSTTNDDLALKRAAQVAAALQEQFSQATIITRTFGDEPDARVVIVRWEIGLRWDLVALGLMVCVLLLIAALQAFNVSKRPQPQPVKLELQPVEMEFDGAVYLVPIERRNGHVCAPHLPESATNTKMLCRADRNKLQQEIRNRLNPDRFPGYEDIFRQLIRDKRIPRKERITV